MASLTLLASCARKPLQYTDVHFLTLAETNEGKSLPVHVVPVNSSLFLEVSSIKPEDWFVDEKAETTPGIQKRVFQGKGTNLLRVERVGDKNDFLIIADFANTNSTMAQRLFMDQRYWREKAVYVLVDTDGMRFISKDMFERGVAN